MGRRKDDPLLQEAKGFPGRRKRQVMQDIAHAEASMTGEPWSDDDPFPVPKFFLKAPTNWKVAIELWRELSEVLKAAGRRRPGYRMPLMRYCAMAQKWQEALDQLRRDLPKGGTTVAVKKGDGEIVLRTHPSIDFMRIAETSMRLLEAEFGFTPRGDSDMERVETFNASQGRLPFQGSAPGQGRPEPDGGDPMALMTDTDSLPPGVRAN